MKLNVISAKGEKLKQVEMPEQFNEELRADIIKRAVLAIQSHNRQRYGAAPMAGKRASAKLSRRRRDFKGSYGLGISRVPRKIMSRNGTRMNWTGAFAPGMVGGRRAHPPKSSKSWDEKVNKKENRKAIRSALAATLIKEIVQSRGHKVPENYPFLMDSSIENTGKTKEIKNILQTIGATADLERADVRKIRAGKGKLRNRKYKTRTGPLLVVSDKCELLKSARNIPGVEIIEIKNINAELLAPGCNPGRLTLYTDAAIEKLKKEKLFM